MSAAKRPAPSKSSTVTKEDQDKINRFARLNTKHVDICSDVADKDRELENYQEAASSIEELELTSEEGDVIPYRVGDVFFNFTFADANSRLEVEKLELEEKKKGRLEEKSELEAEMKTLKGELYSKFGDQINLDPEAD